MAIFYFLVLFSVMALFSIVLMFIFHRLGWQQLEKNYLAENKIVDSINIGIASLGVGDISYRNSVFIKLNKEGIYIRPIFFLWFHKTLFIKWNAVKTTQVKKNILTTYYELELAKTDKKILLGSRIVNWAIMNECLTTISTR